GVVGLPLEDAGHREVHRRFDLVAHAHVDEVPLLGVEAGGAVRLAAVHAGRAVELADLAVLGVVDDRHRAPAVGVHGLEHGVALRRIGVPDDVGRVRGAAGPATAATAARIGRARAGRCIRASALARRATGASAHPAAAAGTAPTTSLRLA